MKLISLARTRNLPGGGGLSIGHRLHAGLIFPVLVFLAVALAGLFLVNQVHRHYVIAAGQQHVLQKQLHQLQGAFGEQNELIRTFLLNPEPEYRSQYLKALKQYQATEKTLLASALTPKVQEGLLQLRAKHQLISQQSREALALSDHGFPSSALFLWETQSSPLKEDMQALLETLAADQAKAMHKQGLLAQSREKSVLWATALLAALVICFSITAGMKINQSFVRDQHRARLKERRQLARDLHDEVSQTLFSANLMAKTSGKLWHKDPDKARLCLDELGGLTQSALSQMRSVLTGLRPDLAGQSDLAAMLRQLAARLEQRNAFELSCHIVDVPVLKEDIQLAFYRVAQEAMNNIVKHARASRVNLYLERKGKLLVLTIKDDGIGFVPGEHRDSSLGLAMMQERAWEINGELEVASQPGFGSQIRLSR